jgi:hypothetical protein
MNLVCFFILYSDLCLVFDLSFHKTFVFLQFLFVAQNKLKSLTMASQPRLQVVLLYQLLTI